MQIILPIRRRLVQAMNCLAVILGGIIVSYQLSQAEVQQYTANVIHLAQQKGSLLRETLRLKQSITGEAFFFERIGPTDAVEITTVHADTPLIDVPHSKRRITPRAWTWATLVDEEQKVKTLIDPQSEYAINAGYSMGRKLDDLVIAAALGNSYSGKTGATAVALPAGQKIAAAATGLTKAKLITANEKFLANKIDPREKKYLLVGSKQVTDLLGITEVSSRDYNNVLPLVEGKVSYWMGFNIIPIEALTLDGSSDRQVIAYTESALGLGIWKEVETDIGPRRDKTNATQILLKFMMDATRVEEEKVIEIACVEA